MKKSRLLLLILPALLCACDVAQSSSKRQTGERFHRVQEGETLYSIAQEAYGDGLEYPRILMANPWVNENNLRVGEVLRLPEIEDPKGNLMAVDPRGAGYDPMPPQEKPKPKKPEQEKKGFRFSFQNILPKLNSGNLFGHPIHKVSFFALTAVMGHALFQGLLLWVLATISFVREVTLKKALKAAIHIEFVALFAGIVLGGVILLMIHIGTTDPQTASSQGLFQIIEGYLDDKLAIGIALFCFLGLYLLLSMRFIPQTFGLHRAQSLILVLFGILLPHLMLLYTLGQRFDIIKL